MAVTKGEVFAPSTEGNGMVEDVDPCWGHGLVDKTSRGIARGACECIVSSSHLRSTIISSMHNIISIY